MGVGLSCTCGRRYVVYSTAFAKRANAVSEFDSARVRRRRERKMLVFGKFNERCLRNTRTPRITPSW